VEEVSIALFQTIIPPVAVCVTNSRTRSILRRSPTFNCKIDSTMVSESPRVRSAALARDTNETKIRLAINLDGGAFPAATDARLTASLEGHAS